MKRRTSFGECGRVAVPLIAIFGVVEIALGQAASDVAPSPDDVSLEATETAPADSALSSVEQGRTPLEQSFGDFRAWRLEERRAALKDTKFEFNFRTYYFDRSDFSGAEKQAWAIGGWAGLKTGYFLDHIAFGVTGYTSQ